MKVINSALQKKHGTTEKYLHYFDAFEFHFSTLKKYRLNLLEIGIQDGGGLWTWEDYFPNGDIYGIDVDPNCKKYEGDRVKIFIGSQNDEMFLQTISAKIGNFDIVIDDGGHTMHQQLVSFKTLFPLMNDGGIYVIEDLHTSYWPQFGGKFKSENTCIEFLKSLVVKLNWWAIHSPRAEPFKSNDDLDLFEKSIKSLHFYDSLCFIYKNQFEVPKKIRL